MKEAGLPQPVFQKEGIFTVTLYRPDDVSGQTTQKMTEKMTGKMTGKILRLIMENSSITTEELAAFFDKSTRTIERQIKILKQEGKLERIGPDKGGYWKVIIRKS